MRYIHKETIFLLSLVFLAACNSNVPTQEISTPTKESTPTASTPPEEGRKIVLQNQSDNMEGHTPRGFQGMGTGLFTGDNLNSRFPEGDGVQIFLTFDLNDVPPGVIESAVLRSENAHIQGTPFEDLGTLVTDEIRYDTFSSALWDLSPEPNGASCDFATSPAGPFACDVTRAVNRSRQDGYRYAQFRLRMTKAGDGDGVQDMVFFFITEPNVNQPGIFELELDIAGSETAAATLPSATSEATIEAVPAATLERSTPTEVPPSSPATTQILAAGEFDLPAATAFGQPGFHETFQFGHNLPPDLSPTAGQQLVVTLRDAGRPEQTCSSEHPLSGCATVDWSDAESRPKVPSGGVFDNSLTVQLGSGLQTFYLSEIGTLADAPDAYDPG